MREGGGNSAALFLFCRSERAMPLPRPHFVSGDNIDTSIVDELVAVLAAHPGGLRRWSVMNAIRQRRRAAARDIPLKMEAEIERTFRQFCARDISDTLGAALFCRPGEKAGEVWALAAPPAVTVVTTAE